ncbi:MAG TPA: CHASE domain-containing protein [Burkholderiales bacterium]|nr:CHASE domain-containing protein [Burkholderiales bacterium]
MTRTDTEGIAGISRLRRWQLLPWLVALIGVAASAFLFTALRHAVEDIARLRFERQASDARAVIEGRIDSYTNVLFSLRALFATHSSVSRLQFQRFVQSLDLTARYPGFEVVNFAAYIPGDQVDAFIDSVRRDTSFVSEGYPRFSIRPPGQRSEYFVLVYLEPMAGNAFAFGLDLGANPAVRGTDPRSLAALQHDARDTGELVASGRPIRIKAEKEYVGLAMRLAVYRGGMPTRTVAERRAAYVGSVGAGFNVEKLMQYALTPEMSRYMEFRLYDAGAVGERATPTPYSQDRLLFDSNPSAHAAQTGGEANNALFTHVLPVDVGGRIWEIHFTAKKDQAIGAVDAFLPWAVLTGGIVFSVLLWGVLFSLGSSRSRAVQIAHRITRDLRESEASLRGSQALLNDAQKLAHVGWCQYSPDDGRMIWSDELYRIHGFDPAAFVPTYENALELVHPEDRPVWEQTLARALSDVAPFTKEFRITRSDGSIRHLRSLGEVMADSGDGPFRMLWSVLDITEQKQTEGALRASAQQLTALSRRLVEVQEAERRKLTRELHDRIGQNLTALSINLDILRTSLSGEGNAEHRTRLGDSSALLESTVDSIEDVMCELRPPMLDDYGLLPALHWYAREFSNRTGIHVDVHGTDHAERSDSDTEIALFRISQEALNNVAKHAQARRVRIELDHPNGQSALTISDDGIGIERALDSEGRQRSGLGMITMRERAETLGGRFEVKSTRAGGTHITVEIPST